MKIKKIRKDMLSQDNRCTSHPIYMVRFIHRQWGIDPDVVDCEYMWYDLNNGCEASGNDEEMLESESMKPTNFKRFEKRYYIDRAVPVMPFFTNKAAEEYILHHSELLFKPHIYVMSGWRSPEWIAVRALLRGDDDDC